MGCQKNWRDHAQSVNRNITIYSIAYVRKKIMCLLWFQECTDIDLLEIKLTIKIET